MAQESHGLHPRETRGELKNCSHCGAPHAGYWPGVNAFCNCCGSSLGDQLDQLRFLQQVRHSMQPPHAADAAAGGQSHANDQGHNGQSTPARDEPQDAGPAISVHCKACGAIMVEQVEGAADLLTAAWFIGAAAAAIQNLPQHNRAAVVAVAMAALQPEAPEGAPQPATSKAAGWLAATRAALAEMDTDGSEQGSQHYL